ncbi:hypothetical protein ACLKA6_001923, partial [Drosophila palustris]
MDSLAILLHVCVGNPASAWTRVDPSPCVDQWLLLRRDAPFGCAPRCLYKSSSNDHSSNSCETQAATSATPAVRKLRETPAVRQRRETR